RGHLAVLADVGDVIRVLVPDAAGVHPAPRGGAEDADTRGARSGAGVGRAGRGVRVRGDHDVGLTVVVDVGDQRILPERTRGVADRRGEEVRPVGAVVHPEVVLVRIDDL